MEVNMICLFVALLVLLAAPFSAVQGGVLEDFEEEDMRGLSLGRENGAYSHTSEADTNTLLKQLLKRVFSLGSHEDPNVNEDIDHDANDVIENAKRLHESPNCRKFGESCGGTAPACCRYTDSRVGHGQRYKMCCVLNFNDNRYGHCFADLSGIPCAQRPLYDESGEGHDHH